MQPEFRFRLNGQIVAEIFIQPTMVNGSSHTPSTAGQQAATTF
jgi:hypothetical protein